MLHHVMLLKVLFLTVSIPFSVHFKLSKKYCTTSNEEKKEDGKYSLFLNFGELSICHGIHKAKYNSCSWSCE